MPSWAGLFDDLEEFEGTVAAIQTNHFVLLGPNNQMIRIMLRPGSNAPQIQPGLKIHVVAEPGNTASDSGVLYLNEWEPIDVPNGKP